MEIDPSIHEHRLVLKPSQRPYTCFGCKELGFGTCYQCNMKNCNFYIHQECALHPSPAFHPFFNKCKFIFYKKAPTKRGLVCDACGKDILGFSYQCTHKDSFDLHPCCLRLKQVIESENGVKLYLKDKIGSKCLYCNSKKIASEVKGWAYVSSCNNYRYHVACVKEIVYESWKKKKSCESMSSSTTGNTSISLSLPSSQGTVSHTYASSSVSKFWKIAKTLLKLIISAIFGDPIGIMVAIAENFM